MPLHRPIASDIAMQTMGHKKAFKLSDGAGWSGYHRTSKISLKTQVYDTNRDYLTRTNGSLTGIF